MSAVYSGVITILYLGQIMRPGKRVALAESIDVLLHCSDYLFSGAISLWVVWSDATVLDARLFHDSIEVEVPKLNSVVHSHLCIG
jgi:hypothetical protein